MSGVRGPNSALTEFLRSQGINANEIRVRHEQRQRKNAAEKESGSNNTDEDKDEKEEGNEQYKKLDIDAIADPEVAKVAKNAALKRLDEIDDGSAICAGCYNKFTVTVYSKPAPDLENAFLCRFCSAESGKLKKLQSKSKDLGAKKKRKKLAADILELRFMTSPSLQDLCIKVIADNIDSIEELGGITTDSFNKISRILSKNRRLLPTTMQMFLRKDVEVLEFWDCSTFAVENYNLIPAMCPNLTKLTLGMCGQMDDDNMHRIAELKSLRELYLDGPFLIRKSAWLDFIDLKGPHLTSLFVKSVYRIDSEVLALLAETCVNLEVLTLERLCQLTDPSPFCLLGNLKNLKHLELIELEHEAWSDHAIGEILNSIGGNLHTLVIKADTGTITDKTVEYIKLNCKSLRRLELVNMLDITDRSVEDLFTYWSENNVPGLKQLSLDKCVNVGTNALKCALIHSGASLEKLNINSLMHVSPDTIDQLAELPALSTLDMSFIGAVNPVNVYKLSTSNSLKQVYAFGNIRLSGMPLPTGVTIVGTM